MDNSEEWMWAPLPKDEVIKSIERQYPARIPMIMTKWWGEGLEEEFGDRLDDFDIYPDDHVYLRLHEFIEYDKMGLSWELPDVRAYDANSILENWDQLDEFIEKLPDPELDHRFDELIEKANEAHRNDRYLIFGWSRLFFERPWQVRGMTNLLMDYYINPEKVIRLNEALCQVYLAYLKRGIRDLKMDGFYTSDDLGHQKQLFMKKETFQDYLKPYYKNIGDFLIENNVHWWLHSCGNNTAILDDLVEVGVTVFHPVQKGPMDEAAVAHEFGDKLTFLVGFDVQHILQEGTPEEVRKEVRYLIDTFDRPGGGMCIAAGNGIVSGTPFENIRAFLDESVKYGSEHCANFNSRLSQRK